MRQAAVYKGQAAAWVDRPDAVPQRAQVRACGALRALGTLPARFVHVRLAGGRLRGKPRRHGRELLPSGEHVALGVADFGLVNVEHPPLLEGQVC